MPLATVRIRMIRATTGADPVYWSWAVDGAVWDEADGSALANATENGLENALSAAGSSEFVNMDADLRECFPGDGGPAYYVEAISPVRPIGTSNLGSHVGQCAVNELAQTPRGEAVVGRMFVGPLSSTSSSVVSNIAKDLCARVMQEVAAAHIAAGYTPVVISRFINGAPRAAPTPYFITGFRADNRWDILKSRRVDPEPTGTTDYPLTFV